MARTVASIVKIAIRMLRRVTGMMKIVTWMVSIIRSSVRQDGLQALFGIHTSSMILLVQYISILVKIKHR